MEVKKGRKGKKRCGRERGGKDGGKARDRGEKQDR